ncbi:helix-turn-helix domain-containing protein [Listeria ilorinensis]|uniref:helix-turn-helix domain-containing protein n=1 Tax=Listeria ilorinensis TaxID=2867439 RepID=UPI001EF49EFF|nr:helix-turn-helix domain-containing protein [Listeria ilorinensis]
MFLILEKNYKRQLSLAALLLNTERKIHLKELAQFQNCSTKTCTQDLYELQKRMPSNWEIVFENNLVYLVKNGTGNFNWLYNQYFESSLSFEFFKTSFKDTSKSVFHFSEELFISKSHLYKKIANFKKALPDEISFSSTTMSLIGEELYIRLALSGVIAKVPSYKKWGFDINSITEDSNYITMIEKELQIKFNPLAKLRFLYWIETCKRRRHMHPIETLRVDKLPFYLALSEETKATLMRNQLPINEMEVMTLMLGAHLNFPYFIDNSEEKYLELFRNHYPENYSLAKAMAESLIGQDSSEYAYVVLYIANLLTIFKEYDYLQFFHTELFCPIEGVEKIVSKKIQNVVEQNCLDLNKREQANLAMYIYNACSNKVVETICSPIKIAFYSEGSLIFQESMVNKIVNRYQGLVEVCLDENAYKDCDLIICDSFFDTENLQQINNRQAVYMWETIPIKRNWHELDELIMEITYNKNVNG